MNETRGRFDISLTKFLSSLNKMYVSITLKFIFRTGGYHDGLKILSR
jgi:hypothetical protein